MPKRRTTPQPTTPVAAGSAPVLTGHDFESWRRDPRKRSEVNPDSDRHCQ